MLPDGVSNPGPLAYESGALPIALRRPAKTIHDLWLAIYIDQKSEKKEMCKKKQ